MCIVLVQTDCDCGLVLGHGGEAAAASHQLGTDPRRSRSRHTVHGSKWRLDDDVGKKQKILLAAVPV